MTDGAPNDREQVHHSSPGAITSAPRCSYQGYERAPLRATNLLAPDLTVGSVSGAEISI